MILSREDCRHLILMEDWCTYNENNPLSLLDVIQNDHKNGGGNFSRFVSEENSKVHSFAMDSIPEADIMLVFGESPRALDYAAEIAVRYRDKYGKYPEFVTVGNLQGSFNQKIPNAQWFENGMIELGFSKDWVLKNHQQAYGQTSREIIWDINQVIRSIPCKTKPKVLVITGVGLSLLAAQTLPKMLPHIDFIFFEVPRLDFSTRLFDVEVFSPQTYAVDKLLANVVIAQIYRPQERIELPIEKKFARPEMAWVKDLLLRGYSAFFNTADMWKFLRLDCNIGLANAAARRKELRVFQKNKNFEEQTKILLKRIRKGFPKRGLIIK